VLSPAPTDAPLRRATLPLLAARGVSVPTYDARALRSGVVHLGVGRFHRAHQARYFDELAERGISAGWGVLGSGFRSASTKDALAAQDHLFTVVQRHDRTEGRPGDGDLDARVVGVLRGYLFAPREHERLVAALAHPDTKLVTVTMTAEAYLPTALTAGEVRLPGSAFGCLVAALDRRRRAGAPPFTVLSCENVPANGDAARDAVLGAASVLRPGLGAWIEREVAFPNSMVDRITPPVTDELRSRLRRRYGLADCCAVVTEPFTQWVVEDRFCNERPPLEEVGVQFVADARPHKELKTRLLNGSHVALGYLGSAAGFTNTAEAMRDPVFGTYVEQLMRAEVAPSLPPVAGVDLAAYQSLLLGRLRSESMGDPLSRLCVRGSMRVPGYVLPSLVDALVAGRPHARLTLVLAGWVRHLRSGEGPDDPAAALLHAAVRRHPGDLRPLLAHRAIFGALGEHPAYAEELSSAVAALDAYGVLGAITLLHEAGEDLLATGIGPGTGPAAPGVVPRQRRRRTWLTGRLSEERDGVAS